MTETAHVATLRRCVVLPRVTTVPAAELFAPGVFAPDLARSPDAAVPALGKPADVGKATAPARRRRRTGVFFATAAGVAVLIAIPLLFVSVPGRAHQPTTSAADRAPGGRNPGA